MKRLFFVVREVSPHDLDDGTMEYFLSAMNQGSKIIHMREKKRRERERRSKPLIL